MMMMMVLRVQPMQRHPVSVSLTHHYYDSVTGLLTRLGLGYSEGMYERMVEEQKGRIERHYCSPAVLLGLFSLLSTALKAEFSSSPCHPRLALHWTGILSTSGFYLLRMVVVVNILCSLLLSAYHSPGWNGRCLQYHWCTGDILFLDLHDAFCPVAVMSLFSLETRYLMLECCHKRCLLLLFLCFSCIISSLIYCLLPPSKDWSPSFWDGCLFHISSSPLDHTFLGSGRTSRHQ